MSNQSGVWAVYHLIKALSGVARADAQQKARQQREQQRRQVPPPKPKQRTGPREWPDPPSWAEGPNRSPTRRPSLSDPRTIRDFRGDIDVPTWVRPVPRAAPVSGPSVPLPPGPEPTPELEPEPELELEPQDQAPVFGEVPARSFARAARLVVATGRVDAAAIQAATGIDDVTMSTIVLALEGTGIVGPPAAHLVLVQPGGLRAIFAQYGMVEDDVPGQ